MNSNVLKPLKNLLIQPTSRLVEAYKKRRLLEPMEPGDLGALGDLGVSSCLLDLGDLVGVSGSLVDLADLGVSASLLDLGDFAVPEGSPGDLDLAFCIANNRRSRN